MVPVSAAGGGPFARGGSIFAGAIHAARLALATLSALALTTTVRAGTCNLDAYPAPSNVGCVFYAVSLPNPFLNQSTFAFGVGVQNVGASTVTVTIDGAGLASPIVRTVAAGASSQVTLPWVTALSTNTATMLRADGAYRISSTGPIIATQFNSTAAVVGMTQSATNDASQLLPDRSASTSYRVLTAPTQSLGGGIITPGYAAIVALADATVVTITGDSNVQPGAGLTASGGVANLNRAGVLVVSSPLVAPNNAEGADLSGAAISSDKPVLVFVGHNAARLPISSSFAEHVEESLPPLSYWGQDFVLARPGAPYAPTGTMRHLVKVVAHEDTALVYAPPQAGAPSIVLAGRFIILDASTDFRLTSDKPVLVASMVEGSSVYGGDKGDPALTFVPPLALAQVDMAFHAPTALAPISAQIVAPAGTVMTVDGNAVSNWTAISGTTYSVAQVLLCCNNEHRAIGDRPFNLAVYAYPGDRTSYYYPGGFQGGLNLFRNGFE